MNFGNLLPRKDLIIVIIIVIVMFIAPRESAGRNMFPVTDGDPVM
jgi:hypothetical protein